MVPDPSYRLAPIPAWKTEDFLGLRRARHHHAGYERITARRFERELVSVELVQLFSATIHNFLASRRAHYQQRPVLLYRQKHRTGFVKYL